MTGVDVEQDGILQEIASVRSLHARGSVIEDPAEQLRLLDEMPLRGSLVETAHFDEELKASEWPSLRPEKLEIFQMNLGKLCNMSCRHCHVDAGPERTEEVMNGKTVDACLFALDSTLAHTVDLTGGAPEMNPNFRYLVDQLVSRGKHVINRSNLTILLQPQYNDLPEWFAERGVELVASLPHYRWRNTDAQRGRRVFDRSIEALRRLNAAGYGRGEPARRLTLMANPAGAFLAANQCAMEPEWKDVLAREHGVTFDSLIMLNNMPIARYLEWLIESDNFAGYMRRLVEAFNPETIPGLMCRNTISISWDGRIFDCDFNQMLEIEALLPDGRVAHVTNFDMNSLAERRICTGRHCYGCTAGSGSSCGGAITD